MKKLMTMLSAAAMAFGLFAEPVVNGTSFEGTDYPEGAITADTLNTAEGGAATWAVADGKAEVKAYADGEAIVDRPNQFKDDPTQDKYLAIKTALGTEFATRAATVAPGDAGLYADMLVKFTAADEAPAIDDSAMKIGVWVKETEGDTASTYNLMVTAGYLADGAVVVTNYDCGVYEGDLDAWHRVTIKSIDNINETGASQNGFAVWVDRTIVRTDDDMSDDDDWKDGLNENAGEFAKEGNLFISATTYSQGISAVAFSGSGSVDDISVTQVLPFDDAADKQANKFTVNGEPVKSIEEAFAAAADVEGEAVIAPIAAYAGNLVITQPISIDTIADGNEIVLDLAGKTITFVGEEGDYAISVNAEGAKLTIIDSSTTTLGCLNSNQGAVKVDEIGGSVTITSGGIKGEMALVDDLNGSFEITGGEFTTNPEDFVAEGYKVVDSTVEGYDYSVVKQVFVNVTVTQGENTTLTVEGVEGGKAEVGETLAVKAALTDTTTYFGLTVTVDDEEILLNEDGEAKVPVKSEDMTIASSAKKIVAKIDDNKYETFEAAVAALTEDSQTIKLLTDWTLKAAITPAYNVTFDLGGFTLDDGGIKKSVTCAAGKTLNVQNGTIAFAAVDFTFEVYGTLNLGDGAVIVRTAKDVNNPGFDVYKGATINVNAGSLVTNSVAKGQVFRFKDGDGSAIVVINGGEVYSTETVFDAYKPNANLIVEIKSGKVTVSGSGKYMFNAGNANTKDDGTYSYDYTNGGVSNTVKITGGELKSDDVFFHVTRADEGCMIDCTLDNTCLAKFSSDKSLNDYCAADFKAKSNGAGWYTIQAIDYATLTVTKGDANVTAVVVSNATAEVTLDDQGKAKFDKDEEVEITVYPTFVDGYELDTAKTPTLTATMTADATITVYSKTAGQVYPPDWKGGDDPVIKEKFATWVATEGKGKGADLTDSLAKDAFLLDCAISEVTAKKAAFKITSITKGDAGWIVKVETAGDEAQYLNGYITIKSAADGKTLVDEENVKAFYKAVLDTVYPAE